MNLLFPKQPFVSLKKKLKSSYQMNAEISIFRQNLENEDQMIISLIIFKRKTNLPSWVLGIRLSRS